jgi:glutamate synthase (NADPH/NADH) large chain
MKASHKALYSYCNAVMEPWDGPAALCATDGRWVVAGKDRSGLRPLRVAYTDDGLVIMGSEAGMCGVEESRITRKLAISPGRMIAIDLVGGKLYGEDDIIDELAAATPIPTGWATWSISKRRSAPAPSRASTAARS